nr:MAG TPA: hypothetical protein [Caudoviricetes sp.]
MDRRNVELYLTGGKRTSYQMFIASNMRFKFFFY